MATQDLLDRLHKVRSSGAGNWVACCPAHEDRSPSLTIKETDDGRVLVHCFAGCSVEQVLTAVGLDFDALFPDKALTLTSLKPHRVRFSAHDVLASVSTELSICSIVINDILRGDSLSAEDLKRFKLAAARVDEACRYATS